jgi:RHS repeat-associated protein
MKKIIFVFAVLALVTSRGFGQTERRNSRGYANYLLIPGSYIQTHDDKFLDAGTWISGFNNYSNTAVIELGLDEDKHVPHTSAFKVCAKFDLVLTSAGQASTVFTNQQLDINYNPADLSTYKDKAQIVFPNIYKAKVYNITISSCSLTTGCSSCTTTYSLTDVYLQAEISTSRIYTFTSTSTFTTGDLSDSLTTTDQLKIAWPYLAGATSYELEYTFVDDYSTSTGTYVATSALTYDLDHDATRIVTGDNHYYIPLTYEHGYIVYRIRPVGTYTNLARMEGAWYPTTASGTLSAAICSQTINPSFPSQTLNWQSAKTFAESGKTGVGVGFSDALGLPRQSLARLNTKAKTIAQSTVFDFYGRPIVDILPSPVSGLSFNYRFGLNVYTTTTVFDKLIVDRVNTNSFCSPSSFSISSSLSGGASNYYSPDNTNKDAFQGYLPDAEDYPFTQVQYTSDGLNKISKQTLPGKLHRLSSGKEIKYVYVNPEQVQIDRIFGSEAGRSNYYHRISATDPNGQVSVEIEDMYGRTVASFLKGLQPSNLDALPNIKTTASLVETYDARPDNTPDTSSWCKEVNKCIEIITANENEGYTYQATWGSAFTGSCNPSLCFHCVYNVTLSITDECGNEIFDYDNNTSTPPGYFGYTIGRQPPYTSTISCSQPTTAFLTGVSLSGSVTINFPRAGKYKIYKKICVSDAPLQDYTNTYLNTACQIDKCQIYNSILNSIDFTGCFPMDCQTCYSLVTTYSNNAASTPTNNFTYTGPLNGGIHMDSGGGTNGSTGVVYTPSMTPQDVSKAMEDCAVYCSYNDRCSTYGKLMEADFYPGTGQFAATSTTSPTWTLSIFNPTNSLPGNITWTNTSLSYLNAAGQTDYVQINGVNKHPYQLSQADFILNFRKNWEKAFMPYHPEACKYYFYCTMMPQALDYDDALLAINHSDDACANGGYWFPVPYSSYSSYKPVGPCSTSTAGIDPVTMLSYTTNAAFATAISNFTTAVTSNFRNTGRDIYEFTAAQAHTAIATGPTSDHLAQDICTADNDWISFRTYYLTSKQILYQNLLTAFLASPSSYGAGSTLGCIVPLPTVAVSHFPDPQGDLNSNFPSSGTLTPGSLYTVSINPPASSNTVALASYTSAMSQFTSLVVPSSTVATTQCSIACNSYTAGWDINLKAACVAYSNAATSTQTAILSAMAAVCGLGCDYYTNLQGASSVAPGTLYTLPSTSYTVANFQQILNYYLPSGGCSTIVLNGPAAYPASNGTVSLNQLSSCQCDIVLEVANEFTTITQPSGTLEWQIFKGKYGFDLPDYYRLKCACQNALSGTWTPGYSWSPTEISALSNYTAAVNPQLVCSSCLSCTDVVMAINSLTLPVASSYTAIADMINRVPGNQIYVKNTLNSQFGLHTLQTYMSLYEDCNSFTTTASAYTFSNTITQTGFDLFTYLESIVENKNMLNTHIMTLCTDDKYYLSSLFSGTLPIIPGYTYTPVQNSNSLTLIISLNATPVASIQLVQPSSYTGGWNNFVQLSNFVAYCPPPQTSGANYGFKVNALDNMQAVVSLTGAVTCTAWPVSYLSYGSYTVPALCPGIPVPKKNSCVVNLLNSALTQAEHEYQNKIASVTATFQAAWKNYCFNTLNESFSRVLNGADEYNYTLYYYDQAGNLQRTVPPNGADPGILSTVTTAIASSVSLLPSYSSSSAVAYNFVNDYHYNSYNELTQENTVDGGLTAYYYDEVGRLMASQNARQLANSTSTANIYSYTLYDALGRMTETGEVTLTSTTAIGQDYYATFQTAITGVSTRSQVTMIYYDRPTTTSSVLAAFTGSVQQSLRNRVAYVTYMDNYSSVATNYDHATYYSYDDHGNVIELVQHNKQLDVFNQGLRNIKYEFELISGNMVKASYQYSRPDQFIHKYYYDEDNRLSEVFTSKDNINWDRDAKYFYYEHGPLARIERADKKVQGTDYFYTIHGWIKGINSDALSQTSDAGKDGTTGNKYLSAYNNVHNWFAKDAMAYSLNYYNTATTADYKPIKTFTTGDVNPLMSLGNFTNNANPFYLDDNSSTLSGDGADLFNGNISCMTTSFIDKDATNAITNNTAFPQLTAYRYDQLQRITKMKSFRSYSASTLTWNPGSSTYYDDAYKMNLSYDNNGNILTLLRNGPGPNLVSSTSYSMDNLSYSYYNTSVYSQSFTATYPLAYNSNRLRCVTDAVSASNYNTDIDNYACTAYTSLVGGDGHGDNYITAGNQRYDYDATGNMIYDKGEFIAKVNWTVDRKVKRIIRDSTGMSSAGISARPDIEYQYNPQRQRVAKIVMPRDPSTYTLMPVQNWIYTYYVYDAGGNVLATYNRAASQVSGSTYKDQLSLSEQDVYGSSRLALARPANTLAAWSYSFNSSCGSGNCRIIPTNGPTPDPTVALSGYNTERDLGYKDFELNNHLGNVITTVSDRKIQASYSPGTCIKTFNFTSGVPPGADINPNNMTLSTSAGSLVCTMQTVSYISGVNPRFGNNLSTSLVYQFDFDFDPGSLTISDALYIVPFDYNGSALTTGGYFWNTGSVPPAGHYTFTYTPTYAGPTYSTYLAFNAGSGTHSFKLGNISLCPAIGSVASYSPDIVSNSDYYPFGQTMPGRTWVGGDSYRYGYQDQEQDPEYWNGAVSYEYRIEDPRVGRFFSVDPLAKSFPWNSPYAFSENRVIDAVEMEGLEEVEVNTEVNPSVSENGNIGVDSEGKQYQAANGKWVGQKEGGINNPVDLDAIEITGPKGKAETPSASSNGGAGSTPQTNSSTNKNDGNFTIPNNLQDVMERIQRVFNTGNYGTGTGSDGYYSKGIKYMSNAIVELMEWLNPIKNDPTSKVTKRTITNSSDKADDVTDEALDVSKETLYEGEGSENSHGKSKTAIKVRNFGDTTVETSFWNPSGSNTKFHTKNLDGKPVGPANEKDKIEYDSQPH